MAHTTRELASRLIRDRRAAHQRLVWEFTASPQVSVMVVLVGISAFAAFATFGMDWATAAGASRWEALVWPMAVTATTMQAFYSRMRFQPGWHEPWLRWFFEFIIMAGFFLALYGDNVHSAGHVQHLNRMVAQLVNFTPSLCLALSVAMVVAFTQAIHVPEMLPRIPRSDIPTPGSPAAGNSESDAAADS